MPEACQQTSTEAYGEGYDRGHLVPANHMDYSERAIKQSNYMTNILPQVAAMNRGAWLHTEAIVECYRDIDELLVIGGVLWGNNPRNDLFIDSHGVAIPEAFWKVIVRGESGNERAIAWIVPNTPQATYGNLDRYLVDIATLEKKTGERFPVPDWLKDVRPESSWVMPVGCDRG